MSAHTEFAKHNDAYVDNFGDKGSLPLPPGKKLIILTCMDARIEYVNAVMLMRVG